MGIQQREINGRALYEAMRTNGVDHIRGEYFTFDSNGKPVAGCALGLMAIHLNIAASESKNAEANLLTQLNNYRVSETSKWYNESTPLVGDTIIHWNDKSHLENVPNEWGGRNSTLVYDLETFKEVHEMVHDVLEPLFDTTFRVDEWVPDWHTLPSSIYEAEQDYSYELY